MPEERPILLPEPGTLRAGAPPYVRSRPGITPITLTFIAAAFLVVIPGIVLFGWNTIRVQAIAIATALLVERAVRALTRHGRQGNEFHALLMGMLVACALPAVVYWPVPLMAAVAAVLIGQILAGGLGNYLWHPVAVGYIATQLLFPEELNPDRWAVLAPGYLVSGDLSSAQPPAVPGTWGSQPLPEGVEAWLVTRPADVLRSAVPAHAGESAPQAIAALIRDRLPPWWDTLTGVAGGAIGEACGLAVIVVGLFLMWRGLLRWPLPVMAILMAALSAAILPVAIRPEGRPMVYHWFPGAAVWEGLPVGLVYVAYQLTACGLLFVVMLLAPDPTSSPLTNRGHALFGATIGVLTITLRMVMGLPEAAYWALVMANTLVPLINRVTRRRVFGT